MARRLNELSLSPTRSMSSSRSSSPRPHAASDPPRYRNPDPIVTRETGVSPQCLEVPAFHQFFSQPAAASSPYFAPLDAAPAAGQSQRLGDENPKAFAEFLRRTTCMSNSSQGTQRSTGSIQRVLSDYSRNYVCTIKQLVKRYTAPCNPDDPFSPVSNMNPGTSWLHDEGAPLEMESSNAHLFTANKHDWEPSITDQRYTTLGAMARERPDDFRQYWLMSDQFGNTVLHALARDVPDDVAKIPNIGDFHGILHTRNTAQQTFLHTLNLCVIKDKGLEEDFVSLILNVSLSGGDIYAPDVYGRTVFHMAANCLDHSYLSKIGPFFPGWSSKLKRDAFDVLPMLGSEDHDILGSPDIHENPIDIYETSIDIQETPIDIGPWPDWAPARNPTLNAQQAASISEETCLLKVIHDAMTQPKLEHTDGGNGLHCLASATLGEASLQRKYDTGEAQEGAWTIGTNRGLDSSSERFSFRLSLLENLIKAGVDVNHYDHYGNTPLMAFSALMPEDGDYKVGPKILEKLIQANANVHARNRRGETALHVAVRCGRKLAMRVLVEKGANVHARNSELRGLLEVIDHKMMHSSTPAEYAHLEACRAWMSGKGGALQFPSELLEWGKKRETRRGRSSGGSSRG